MLRPVAMRPLLAAALLALLTLPAASALAPAVDAQAVAQPPIIEVRDCYEFPNGREIYVLGHGLGCMGPSTSDASAATGPVVEVKECPGQTPGAQGVYVNGNLVVCFKRPFVQPGIVEVRTCSGPAGPGVGVYVLGAEIVCIY